MSKKKSPLPARARSSRSPSPSASKAKKPKRRRHAKRTLAQIFASEQRFKRHREARERKEARRLRREAAAQLDLLNSQAALYTRQTRTLLSRVAAYDRAQHAPFLEEWRASREIVIAAGHVARFASHSGGDLPPLPLPCSALPPLC